MIFIHGGIHEFYDGHRITPVFRHLTELALFTNKTPSCYVRSTLPYCQCVQKHSLWSFSHMLVGYMRVSSDNDRRTTNLQRDALIKSGSIHGICLKTRPAALVMTG
ncbi:MAG: hypothetical protein ABL933_11665 [Methyloglobulus sp.]